MIRALARIFSLKVLAAIVTVFLAWQVWVFCRPRPRQYSPAERSAILAACGNVAAVLGEKVPSGSRFGVAHFVNDPRDVVTDAVKDALRRQGWSVEMNSPVQRFLADVSRAVGNASGLDEVVNAGRRVDMDVIVAGKVAAVKMVSDDAAEAALDLYVYDVRPGKWILRETITSACQPGPLRRAAAGLRRVHPGWRFALWLTVLLALPWATSFATHRILERKSNLAGFALLTGYTAVNVLLALALTSFNVSGTGGAARFLAVVVLAACYNFWACEKIGAKAA